MTVPPNQPQRPSDDLQPQTESPPRTDTPPTTDAPTTTDGPATAGQHHQPHGPAHPEAAPAPPATTYLSGILTAGLAAICGAVFTSWAGVQGTIVGAMIGATIGSSVSEVVRAPLDTLERRLVAAGFSARKLRQDGVVKTVVTSPTAAQQAFGMISRGAIVTVGATAIVGFLLAIGGVTVAEVAAGEPLAALVSDEPATGTTIGNVVQNAPPARAPAPAATDSTSPSAPTSGRSGGGVTSSKPADPILGAEDPNVAGSPSPTATIAAANEAENANSAASPSPASGQAALASPDATAESASTTPGTPKSTATLSSAPMLDGSATATASSSPSAVQVVTVVVTATPTPSPTSATQAVGAAPSAPAATSTSAPVLIQTSTPTPSRTPTSTFTSTPVTAPGAPSVSPPAPPPAPQT